MREIWRIIRFTAELKRYYIAVSVFTILIAGMTQLAPLLTKGVIDEITRALGGGEVNLVLVAILVLAIFITDVAQSIFSNIGGHIGDMLSARLRFSLSRRYYEHVMRLPQQYFDSQLTGTIINRMNRGIQQISDFMQMLSNNFLQFIFSTVFTLIIVAYYSWPVAIMLLTLYPVYIWMTARTSKKWQTYQKVVNQDLDEASGRFAESVGQIKVVKGFVRQAHELKLFGSSMRHMIATTKPQSTYWHVQDTKRRVVLAIIFFAVYGFVFWQAARGVYTIGETVLLIQYAQLIRIPLFSISFLVDRTQRAVADSRDYFAVMDEAPEQEDRSRSRLSVTRGAIVFDTVTFSYDKKPVLKKISFSIPAKAKIALVGESGGGKTTLTSLLMRLYEPTSGVITIDGTDISRVSRDSLRSHIGVVFQEPALFSGTIRENISYGKPGATNSEIIAAAKAANAHEFVSKLANGYDTEIGERGLKLSGGQKQRIAIARALLKDAPILILDEATSSLDSKSEQLVHEALEKLMKGRTTIIIAHRLSTIRSVDTVITLKHGKVDEIGTPEELESTAGIYAQLLALQQAKPETAKNRMKKYDIAGD